MDEEEVERLLKAFPGSKRAAQGVLIDLPGGNVFHVYGRTQKKELEGLTAQEQMLMPFCAKSETLRLRNLRSPYDYLLRVRAEAIADSPRMVRVMAKRRRLFEATGKAWALTHYYHFADQIALAGMSVLVYVSMLMRLKKSYTLKTLPVSETHPDPIDRLWALTDYLGTRSPLNKAEVNHMLVVGEQLLEIFPRLLHSAARADLLTFYGSIYLPGSFKRMKVDRIDF